VELSITQFPEVCIFERLTVYTCDGGYENKSEIFNNKTSKGMERLFWLF
jgi:hypothetical protein